MEITLTNLTSIQFYIFCILERKDYHEPIQPLLLLPVSKGNTIKVEKINQLVLDGHETRQVESTGDSIICFSPVLLYQKTNRLYVFSETKAVLELNEWDIIEMMMGSKFSTKFVYPSRCDVRYYFC